MKNQSCLLKKGLIYYRENELSKSKEALNQVLEKEPKNKQALLLLGKISLEEKDFVRALNYLSKAESEELTKLRLSTSPSSQLLEDSKNSIKPIDIEISKELGLALEQLSYKPCEINVDEDFRQILKRIMPPYWERHFNCKSLKSDVYMEAGNIWDTLSKIAPDNLEILTNHAFWEHRWGGTSGSVPYIAKIIWKQILGLDKRNVLSKYKINEYESRLKAETRINLNSLEFLFKNNLTKGQYLQGLKQYSTYKPYNKSPTDRKLEIEEDYLKTGNFLKLIEDLEDLEKKKNDPKIKIVLSKLYKQRGKDLKAKELLKGAVEIIFKNEKNDFRHPSSGKSKNEVLVYTYQPSLAYFFANVIPPGSIIFKKNENLTQFRKEKKAIGYFRGINKKFNLDLNLPEVLFCTKFEDEEYIVMESGLASHCNAYATDASLKLKIKNKSEKNDLLKQLVEEIAKIHVWFPNEKSGLLEIVHTEDKERNKRYYIEKIKTKLFGINGLAKRKRRLWLELKEKTGSLFNEVINEKESIKKSLEDKITRETEHYKNCFDELVQKIEAKEDYLTHFLNYGEIGRFVLQRIGNIIFSEGIRYEGVYKELIEKNFEEGKKEIIDYFKQRLEEYVHTKEDHIKRLEGVKNKIESRLNCENNIFEQKFLENYSVILEIISDLKPGAYKDSIFKNFLIDYENNLIAIDFETLRNLPYQMDLATAFEFEDSHISDNDSEENSRKNLLKIYAQKFNEQIKEYDLQKEKIENFEDFEKGYYACAVQRALIHYGSFSSLGYDYDKCIKFIDRAIWNINKLRSYFPQESGEYQKLGTLQGLLTGFSSSNKLEFEKLQNSFLKVEEEIRSFDFDWALSKIQRYCGC